ncbi:DUF2259 domain-containing protein [Phreatobacter sp. AB_2022a]|uniref:DUF2259 domain-containing protein n=1 Tax=Phreatobacter sp. AB_2022a TaxID=3003134 RepID=UPI000579B40D|nr:DUF2259 domain-containing protein [Phreatobacter sp. AB_2022a]MCZ0738803.1 DUF2259 domain-containing protein [Phreatobacter sp. AB_2022a]CEJ15554.1 hypothetical protein BN1110_05899 [bacterium YEK0313]
MRAVSVILAAICAYLMAGAMVLAGDFAAVRPLGFSGDGRYFAFEEFGTRDASIHPFAAIHVVDLDGGTQVAGSPFAVEIQREHAPEQEARAAALKQAEATLRRLGIGREPAASVSDPRGDLTEGVTPDRAHAAIAAQASRLAIEGAVAGGPLAVEVLSSPTRDADCAARGRDDVEGFSLVRVLPSGERATVHVDTGKASARHCPLRYGLAALYLARPDQGRARLVALVSYFPRTWEEPDRRFLAVPVALPD